MAVSYFCDLKYSATRKKALEGEGVEVRDETTAHFY
jgi:hypothetical protein